MGMSHGNMYLKMIVCASWSWLHRSHCTKSHESSQTCLCMCSTASCMLYCVQWTLHMQNSTALEISLVKYLRRWISECTWLMPVMGMSLQPSSVEVLERYLTTSLCARHRTEVCAFILQACVGTCFCTYYRGMKHGGPPDWYVVSRFT